MPRSLKKGPFIDLSIQRTLRRIADGGPKPPAIKTWSRRSTITPDTLTSVARLGGREMVGGLRAGGLRAT